MPNNRKTYKLCVFSAPLVFLALTVAGLAYIGYIGSNSGNRKQSVLASKSSKAQNSNKNKGVKETLNSKVFRQNISKFVNNLEQVATSEQEVGNIETSQEVQDVADTEEQNAEDIADSISAVESRPKWKTLLIGSDYKNLGQLRSSLSHIQNDIRKLSSNSGNITDSANQTQLQTQLTLLTAERNRIISVIVDNKEQFSILGWVKSLFSGGETPTTGGIGGVEETTESTSGSDATGESSPPSASE